MRGHDFIYSLHSIDPCQSKDLHLVHKKRPFCGWTSTFDDFIHENGPFCGQQMFYTRSAGKSVRGREANCPCTESCRNLWRRSFKTITIMLLTLHSAEVSATPLFCINLLFKWLQKTPVADASSKWSVGNARNNDFTGRQLTWSTTASLAGRENLLRAYFLQQSPKSIPTDTKKPETKHDAHDFTASWP